MTPRSEQELLDCTIDLARRCRWSVTHFRAARTRAGYRTAVQGHPGWPDLALARHGVLILRELKGDRGRVSPEQFDWARQLTPGWVERRGWVPEEETAVLFDVWRPGDWQTRIIPTLTQRKDQRS